MNFTKMKKISHDYGKTCSLNCDLGGNICFFSPLFLKTREKYVSFALFLWTFELFLPFIFGLLFNHGHILDFFQTFEKTFKFISNLIQIQLQFFLKWKHITQSIFLKWKHITQTQKRLFKSFKFNLDFYSTAVTFWISSKHLKKPSNLVQIWFKFNSNFFEMKAHNPNSNFF